MITINGNHFADFQGYSMIQNEQTIQADMMY